MRQGYLDQQFQDIIIANSPVTRSVWPHVLDADVSLKASLAPIIGAQKTDTVRTVRVIERELEMAGTLRSRAISDLLHSYPARAKLSIAGA
jgi:hypothetical protein